MWLSFIVLSWATAAEPIAVLPFSKGVGSVTYEGFGEALASMVITDLVTAGLPLVERERLSDVLTEVDLSQTNYVDPTRAVEIGKVVGAGRLAVGTWSVIDDRLALDLRLVETKTARVVHASSADGPVTDFVAVEKEVTSDLLGALASEAQAGSRSRIQANVPTFDFEAFKAYAQGLADEKDGKIEAARKAFVRATELDPSFSAAAARLANVRERLTAGAREKEQDQLANAARVVERTQTIRHSAKTTPGVLAQLGLRWVALDDLGRHCDRHEEMYGFVKRHRFRLPNADLQRVAREIDGFIVKWSIPLGPTKKLGSMAARTYDRKHRALAVFADAKGFFSANSMMGMLWSMQQCLPPTEELSLLLELAQQGSPLATPVGLAPMPTMFELQWLGRHGYLEGPNDAWQLRINRILDAHPPGSEHHDVVTTMAKVAVDAAASWPGRKRFLGPYRVPDHVAILEELAADRAAIRVTGTSRVCMEGLKRVRPVAGSQIAKYRQKMAQGFVGDAHGVIFETGSRIQALHALGCLDDQKPTLPDIVAVAARAQDGLARPFAEGAPGLACSEEREALEARTTGQALVGQEGDPKAHWRLTAAVLAAEALGCLDGR